MLNSIDDKRTNALVSREEVLITQRKALQRGIPISIRRKITDDIFAKRKLTNDDQEYLRYVHSQSQKEATKDTIKFGRYGIAQRLYKVFCRKLRLKKPLDEIREYEETRKRIPELLMFNGPTASGKTHHAFRIATELGITGIDADILHPLVNVQLMQQGTPLQEHQRAFWIINVQNLVRELVSNGLSVSIAYPGHKKTQRDALRSVTANSITIQCECDLQDLQSRVAEREHPYIPKDCTPLLERQLSGTEWLTAEELKSGGIILNTRNYIPYESVRHHLYETMNDKLLLRRTRAELR